MSETAHQRRQKILMRLALSRVQAVESLDSAVHDVRAGWERLPSPKNLAKGAALLGTGAVLCRAFIRAFRRRPVPVAAPVVNPWRGVAAQAVSLLLLPFLHRLFTQGMPEFRRPHLPSLPSVPRLADIPTPSDLFFRWLGLQK